MAHDISNFLDSVKERLTDAEYKEGMEICQKVFHTKEDKLYRMTYLRPYTFITSHCEDEECMDSKLLVSFEKAYALVRLSDNRAEQIREEHVFLGTEEQMNDFIDVNILRSFPEDREDLDSDLNWYEFPVISLETLQE
jgi:hypothetical protein